MSRFEWLPGFLARLASEHVVVQDTDAQTLAPAQTLRLDAEDWGKVARVAAAFGCRWAGVWADMTGTDFMIRACLAWRGDYLVLVTHIPVHLPVLASHTPHFAGANRMERHLQDLYGIALSDHPDGRRWTRHRAWPEDRFPLRTDFPASGEAPKRTAADSDYPFVRVLGSGVYQIPVGPVHAGIIEPGHFRFQAVGESVLRLEARLGYVHKGIEKIAVGRDAPALARLAGRVSGDSTVGHGWAACMAMERAAGITVPPCALYIRAILAERERVANHLGDIGAICNDVSFSFAHMQCSRLREDWLRINLSVFGHRLLMDRIVPGGVAHPLTPQAVELLRQQNHALRSELAVLTPMLEDDPSLEDRLVHTGVLSRADAQRLGVVGYVGKASGMDYDARRDHRYAPYDQLDVESPCLQEGDVAARVQIRIQELHQSLRLLDTLLRQLPEGATCVPWPATVSGGEGIGVVEGWRGEIISHVRFDESGRIARYFPRDPSWFSWPALEQLIHGNIVPDFPVCNKSVNGSYSGHDL
jgi:Ni,Fe-hydrogenase III large subunit